MSTATSPLDFGDPIPAAFASELETLFAISFLCVDERKGRTQRAVDMFVAIDAAGFRISLDRALSKIHAANRSAIVCFQGRAPFVLLDIRDKGRERAFSDALMSHDGEMHAVFVPTFRWCITRNHDTPGFLTHAKPDRLRQSWTPPHPDIPGDRVEAAARRIAELVAADESR